MRHEPAPYERRGIPVESNMRGVLLAAQLAVGAAFVANYRHYEPRPAHALLSARVTYRNPLLAAPGPPLSSGRRPRRVAPLFASGRGAHIVEARERFAKFFVTSDECASLDVTPVPIEGVRPEEFDGWLASQVRAFLPPVCGRPPSPPSPFPHPPPWW